MKKSYISLLTKNDFEELERVVMRIDRFDSSQTIITRDKRNDFVDVVFWEWVDDEEDDNGGYYVETRYLYESFDSPQCYDVIIYNEESEKIRKRFFEWMVKKFGDEYIKAYFHNKTGADINGN